MHNHSHQSESPHLAATSRRPLLMTLLIVLVVMVAEVIGGILSNSLALLGDAGHMLVDALALALSIAAITMARRPATRTRTYGYHRMEILAALANGLTVGLVAFYIFYEAYQRFLTPPTVKPSLMILVATVGLIANIIGIILLRKGSLVSLNIKSALWHIIGDTISSVGVIVAAIVISVTGWAMADPIIAVVIGIIILWGAVRLVLESVDILAETVPKHIPLDKVIQAIKKIPGVADVHDIHIWTLTSGVYALSAHLLITDQMVSSSAEIIQTTQQTLELHYNITHSTLQLECEKCESCPTGIICEIQRPE
ncbi:MAG: cation transporter [Dehalococcoidales bacterium]|jgi:cobalt-zinc-cadmium efflux system protein|nr:cation transporter [Dehalococcoidales bacterium]MDP6222167.1 cation diffusion facilitator family transporter [Dehalococcoidales bacterium]MDP7109822.1 cation diffusion facilitator family transporter [Dehalococcoidales bacterium]MDP7309533.1 cation diffusion facilitator family transporter [Dehalococcoidales bacterium]MDP7409534.1 cation diffusion facilitator family transporter [Dehalococcoidales bacterium]